MSFRFFWVVHNVLTIHRVNKLSFYRDFVLVSTQHLNTINDCSVCGWKKYKIRGQSKHLDQRRKELLRHIFGRFNVTKNWEMCWSIWLFPAKNQTHWIWFKDIIISKLWLKQIQNITITINVLNVRNYVTISNWIDHLWDSNKSYSPALSSNNKKRVDSVVLQWYTPQRKTPHMRLPFNTSLDLYGNTRDCVRTQIARGDRPQDIHHLQGGILLCQHVRAQGQNSSCFPSPGRRVKKGGGYLASKPFIMFFPKQLLCKQIWLLVGKSVISTLDLSSTSPLWLHRFNHPSCHLSEAASHGGGFLWEL